MPSLANMALMCRATTAGAKGSLDELFMRLPDNNRQKRERVRRGGHSELTATPVDLLTWRIVQEDPSAVGEGIPGY